MSYSPSGLVMHAWQHPPRCVSTFRVTPVEAPSASPYLHDELALFNLGCPCGVTGLEVHGYPDGEGGLFCPLSARCPGCNLIHPIFDAELHGYDAEFGHGCYSTRGAGSTTRHACACGSVAFRLCASFSYQIEPVEDLGDDANSHIQDFFDVFGLESECAGCGVRSSLSEYECA